MRPRKNFSKKKFGGGGGGDLGGRFGEKIFFLEKFFLSLIFGKKNFFKIFLSLISFGKICQNFSKSRFASH